MENNTDLARYISGGLNEVVAEKITQINQEKTRGNDEYKKSCRKNAYIESFKKLAEKHCNLSENDLRTKFNPNELSQVADNLYAKCQKQVRWRIPLFFCIMAGSFVTVVSFPCGLFLWDDLLRKYKTPWWMIGAYVKFWQNHKWFKENFDYKNI